MRDRGALPHAAVARAVRPKGAVLFEVYLPRTVTYGYHCEECEDAIWLPTTRAELQWLKDREHVAREVARHVQSGLDTWINEGLDFLDKHHGHSVMLTKRP